MRHPTPSRKARANLRILRERIKKIPFVRFLDIELSSPDGMSCEMTMGVVQKLRNYLGGVHGGAITSLIDTAVYFAILPRLPEKKTLTTTELKVNFFRPPRRGTLKAKAKVIHLGKRTAVGEAEIQDDEGNLVAKGTVGHLIS